MPNRHQLAGFISFVLVGSVFMPANASNSGSVCDEDYWYQLGDSMVCELLPQYALPWDVSGSETYGVLNSFVIPSNAISVEAIFVADGANVELQARGGEVVYWQQNSPGGTYRVILEQTEGGIAANPDIFLQKFDTDLDSFVSIAGAAHAVDIPVMAAAAYTAPSKPTSEWVGALNQQIWEFPAFNILVLGQPLTADYSPVSDHYTFDWNTGVVSGVADFSIITPFGAGNTSWVEIQPTVLMAPQFAVQPLNGIIEQSPPGSAGYVTLRVLMGEPAPASAQYNGPIALMVQRTGLPAGTRATATAERMTGITRVLVDGVSVDFKIESDSKITFLVPSNLKPGTYPVHFEVGPNTTLTDKVTVSRVAASASTYQANRLFANYQGDNQSVAPADAAAILSFVSKYKNVTSVTCIGSTSGIPAEPADQALALSRAKNACDLIQKQIPSATITLKTSVGKDVGQKFRSVQVFLQGNK